MLQNIRACRNEKPLWSSGTSAEQADLTHPQGPFSAAGPVRCWRVEQRSG
jgi:hypothetical protein